VFGICEADGVEGVLSGGGQVRQRDHAPTEEGKIDVDRQIELVAELARTAPTSIQADADIFLDSLQRVGDDPSLKDDPDVREAVDNVNRLANQACGVYDRKSGI